MVSGIVLGSDASFKMILRVTGASQQMLSRTIANPQVETPSLPKHHFHSPKDIKALRKKDPRIPSRWILQARQGRRGWAQWVPWRCFVNMIKSSGRNSFATSGGMWPLAIASTESISDVSSVGSRARRLSAPSAPSQMMLSMSCEANVVENQLLWCGEGMVWVIGM
jgi:hypothetical protein